MGGWSLLRMACMNVIMSKQKEQEQEQEQQEQQEQQQPRPVLLPPPVLQKFVQQS